MTPLRRIMVATAVCSGLVLSCQAIIGIRDKDDLHVDESPSSSSSSSSSSGGDPGCGVTLPPPPLEDTADDGRSYFFALQTIALGGEHDGVGFNLDNASTACADPATRGTCAAPDGSATACDLDGGIDNAFFPITQSFAKGTVKKLNDGVVKEYACGRQNLVFVLQEYNGLPNDKRVLVSVLRSHGIVEPSVGVDAGHGECLPTYPARFEGHDRWFIDERLIGDQGTPKPQAFAGYVSEGKLVIDGRVGNERAAPMEVVGLGSPPVVLQSPVLVATLSTSRDGGLLMTDGVMAGRANLTAMLTSLGEIPNKGASAYCASGADWESVRFGLCNVVDLATAPPRDFSTDLCDALSLVVAFTTAPVTFELGRAPDAAPPTCDASLLSCTNLK